MYRWEERPYTRPYILARFGSVECGGNLRTYKIFKKSIRVEPYLKVQYPKHRFFFDRIARSQIRMSTHNLAIETGRHKSQSPDERLCSYCHVPETEMHHNNDYVLHEI